MPRDRASLSQAHRVVVKLGTHVVMRDGAELHAERLDALCAGVAAERRAGREVLVVSSGAVGMGMKTLGLRERPRSLGLRQACAAVGQGHLIKAYTDALARHGLVAAQVLLSQDDLGDRDRALCLRTTLLRLLELGAIPILNENDSVSVRELEEYVGRASGAGPATPVFGDNDGLSARVAVCVDADLLVLLTNVDGFFSAPPGTPGAARVATLAAIDDRALAAAGGSSPGGLGGMASKLGAARLAGAEGVAVVIAGGGTPDVLRRVLAGEDVGTFVPPSEPHTPRLRRIAVGAKQRGALIVNDGALRALNQGKASLLPVGVTGVDGDFDKGDVVELRDGSGRVHGRGVVNYDAAACRKLAGEKSDRIAEILGYEGYDALVTRDNLVMGQV